MNPPSQDNSARDTSTEDSPAQDNPAEPQTPDELVRVAVAKNELTAALLGSLLDSKNIHSHATGGAMSPFIGSGAEDAALWVRRADYPAAASFLRQFANTEEGETNETTKAPVRCRRCRYPLAGVPAVDAAVRCPECGADSRPPPFDSQGHCVACRYDLTQTPEADACPSCGLDLNALSAARSDYTIVHLPSRAPRPFWIVVWIGWTFITLFGLGILALTLVAALALIGALRP